MGNVVRVVAAALLVAVTAVPFGSHVARAGTPARLASPEIFGWLPYWRTNPQIDYGAITTIAYFGLPARADGRLARTTAAGKPTTQYKRWIGAGMTNVIANAHAAGGRVVLTVSRFAWDSAGIATTEALLSSAPARATLVGEIVSEITSRGADGVNVDFEPILASQRDNFAAFVRELRAGLDAADSRYQLTIASSLFDETAGFEMLDELVDEGAADAVIVMAYTSRVGPAAGGIAPMDSPTTYHLTDYVPAYLASIDANKLVVAFPWYGREGPTRAGTAHALWRTNTALYGGQRNVAYTNAVAQAVAHGRRYSPVEQSAWTAYRTRLCTGCRLTWKQVYYDDADTLSSKIDWAMSLGVAGTGVWALGNDGNRPELWKMLRVKFRGLIDSAAPTGSFAVQSSAAPCGTSQRRLTFALDDGANGSGPVFIRVSGKPDAAGGVLTTGMMFPYATQLCWSPGSWSNVYVQWRDVAGNWSAVSSAPL